MLSSAASATGQTASSSSHVGGILEWPSSCSGWQAPPLPCYSAALPSLMCTEATTARFEHKFHFRLGFAVGLQQHHPSSSIAKLCCC
ncbi:hypothetical protein BDA96_03G060700 [Sorghum bicolor]|uniref:Uncharacterized protein n=2 Tax=Sorghum bicolor TaxID=4558 RepID=A0A921RB84_SORBI|nr:hypothetical protein BDA96_03G060700 [Sorghum bicolor]KXG31793.1 hypothetical protein SORBI_3003G056700 [Sorghum bicolor]